jgi:histone H2A
MEERKKKKSHFFEIYIQKVLKQVSHNSAICLDAKQQFNSFICALAKHLSSIATEMTIFAKKKTISEKEICNALIFVLSGEILTNSISEGDRALNNFLETNEAKSTRQSKANIIFPPSITEKFLRNFGNSKLFVKSSAPIFLAGVLEYITSDILGSASIITFEDKRNRVTIRDIELAVRSDNELNKLMSSLNFSFIGGGVLPFIHPLLLKKKPKTYHSKGSKNRFRPGTVAIREMKKYQKNSHQLLLPKSTFEAVIRNFFKENTETTLKISADVFLILQHLIETYLVNLLRDANLLAIHSNRVKLTSVDIALVSYLKGQTNNPYINTEIPEINIDNTLTEPELLTSEEEQESSYYSDESSVELSSDTSSIST